MVCSSTAGSDDAIRNAIERVGQSVLNMDWLEIVETRGHLEDGKVAHCSSHLRIIVLT